MAAKKGHTAGFSMSTAHRVKIQNSNILNALIEHAEGRREMSSTQVAAALGLLRKIMPDLAVTEISGEVQHSFVARMPAKAIDGTAWLTENSPSSGSRSLAPKQH